MEFFLMILFGVLGGIFGGMGMGGGTILIPLLTLFLGFDQKVSQGFNLISFLIMAIIALIIHNKNGFVSTKGIVPIIITGIIFSIIGALLADYMPSNILRIMFGVFLCVLAVIEFIKVFRVKKNQTK